MNQVVELPRQQAGGIVKLDRMAVAEVVQHAMVVQEVMQVVRAMRDEGLSVLLVEQNVPLALGIADRAYVLDDGKVVYAGSAGELAANRELVDKLAGATAESKGSSSHASVAPAS